MIKKRPTTGSINLSDLLPPQEADTSVATKDLHPPEPPPVRSLAADLLPPEPVSAPAEALNPYAYIEDDALAQRVENLEGVLTPAMIAQKLMAPPASALRTAGDLLSRGMYAAAGTTQEVMRGTPQNIPSRILKETLSGVAGLRGEKKDFGQVFKEQGVPEGYKLKMPKGITDFFEIDKDSGVSVRDAAGLAADLVVDPINLVGFGMTGVVRKLPVLKDGKYVGAINLNKKGLQELNTLAKAERPEAFRYALALSKGEKNMVSPRLTLGQALDEARNIEVAADEVAFEAAAARISDRVAAGQGKNLVDEGGLKFAGKTIVSGKPFHSLTSYLAGTNPGRAINKLARPVINELDRAFNETDKFARSIPGYEQLKVQLRDYHHNHLVGPGGLKQTVKAYTEHLPDDVSEAIVRHIDNPAKYPTESIPDQWQHLIPKVKSLTSEWFDKESRRGLIPETSYRFNYIPHMFDNTPEELAQLSTHYASKTGRSMGQFTLGPSKEVRSFDTLDDIEEFTKTLKQEGIINWDLKPVTKLETLLTRRGMAHINAMAADQFFTSIKARLGVPEAEMARTVPLINDSKVAEYGLAKAWGYGGEPLVRREGGRFEGWWLPQQIHRDLDGMEKQLLDTKEVATLLKGFDFIQDGFKLGNTVIFPAYHTRNAYSNIASNFVSIGLSSLNPKKYIKAAAVMTGKDGTLLTPLRRYTFDEVRHIAWEQGIFKDFAQQAELRSGKRASLDDIPIVNLASKGGSAIENDSRLMLFMKHLEDGAPPEQAAKMVKRFLFDYEAISPIERQFISRVIPFWIWRKKNLALTAQEMLRVPGRYAAQTKLFYNPGESGPDPMALPDYLRGSLKVKLGKRDGKASFLTGIDLPMNSALEIVFNDDVQKTLSANAATIHPVLKSIMEMASGKELFTGRDLYAPVRLGGLGEAIKKMPKPMQQWLEFREQEGPDGKPQYYASGVKTYLLFRGWAQARMLSTFDRVMRYDNDLKGAILDVVAGLHTKEVDLTDDQEKVIRSRVSKLEEELYKKGQYKRIQRYQPNE